MTRFLPTRVLNCPPHLFAWRELLVIPLNDPKTLQSRFVPEKPLFPYPCWCRLPLGMRGELLQSS